MTTAITEEMVKALADGELVKVNDWIAAEQRVREKRRKASTLAKIRELAKSIEVGVKIEGKSKRSTQGTAA